MNLIKSIWFFLLLPGTVFSQEFKAELLTGDEARIGEPIRVQLSFGFPNKAEPPILIAPDSGNVLNGVFEVVNASDIKILGSGFSSEFRIDIELVCWDTGYHAIPPFGASYRGDSVYTEALLVHIPDVPVDMSKAPKDIKDIYDAEWTWQDQLRDFLQDNWPYIVIGLLVIIIGILAYLYFFRWRKKEEAAVPDLPAHELAFLMMDRLEQKRLWQQGKLKEYHSELSEILREYIENRFRVQALEQTTDEILQNLKFSDMEKRSKRKLREILKLSDLVKFAKEQPTPAENEQALIAAREFVADASSAFEEETENEETTETIE